MAQSHVFSGHPQRLPGPWAGGPTGALGGSFRAACTVFTITPSTAMVTSRRPGAAPLHLCPERQCAETHRAGPRSLHRVGAAEAHCCLQLPQVQPEPAVGVGLWLSQSILAQPALCAGRHVNSPQSSCPFRHRHRHIPTPRGDRHWLSSHATHAKGSLLVLLAPRS